MADSNVYKFQERLNYTFKDIKLLRAALTHSSFARCNHDDSTELFKNNERLEFLGDAVLGLCVGEKLFKTYPLAKEGVLSRTRAAAVCEDALYKAAKKIGVNEFILMSYGEAMSGGRDKPSILSDALEAIIGAIYLDGGLEEARKFVLSFTNVTDYYNESLKKDSKTRLQEYVQERHMGRITYDVIGVEGPDHKRTFTIELKVGGKVFGIGKGSSKHEAGMNAASIALQELKN